MTRPTITFACGDYDRVWALRDGRVSVEGADLNMISLQPEECFWRMIRFGEFDVAEMSLSSYSILRSTGDDRFVGIPAFLSRSFRHESIYVRADAGIAEPGDLRGRRVGVPEYQMTASVWARGMLSDDYGVGSESITWCTGGLEQPGRVERQALKLSRPVRIEGIDIGRTLSQALVAGEIDALMAPRVPSVFSVGTSRRGDRTGIRRLFADYAALEVEQFRRTGVFPIMHLVVLRSDVFQRYPWLAQSIFKALEAAKRLALQGLTEAPALRYTMPLLLDALERQREIFGTDPWPYGLEANRPTLETFSRYLVEQGLSEHALDVDALFAPSTLAGARI